MNNLIDKQHSTPVERGIVSRLIKSILDDGYKIAVHDGEEYVTKITYKRADIERALCGTGHDSLVIFKAPIDGLSVRARRTGGIYLIWGNGEEIICDYTDIPQIDEWVNSAECSA